LPKEKEVRTREGVTGEYDSTKVLRKAGVGSARHLWKSPKERKDSMIPTKKDETLSWYLLKKNGKKSRRDGGGCPKLQAKRGGGHLELGRILKGLRMRLTSALLPE